MPCFLFFFCKCSYGSNTRKRLSLQKLPPTFVYNYTLYCMYIINILQLAVRTHSNQLFQRCTSYNIGICTVWRGAYLRQLDKVCPQISDILRTRCICLHLPTYIPLVHFAVMFSVVTMRFHWVRISQQYFHSSTREDVTQSNPI